MGGVTTETDSHHGYRENDVVSGLSHLVGAALSVAVLVLLVVFGASRGTVGHIVGFALFGAGLVLLYIASALYHLIPHHRPAMKHVFQRLDHAMIFVLIAGTYTPVTFLALPPAWGWSLFGVIWGLALIGVITKLLWLRVPKIFAVALYVVMGWVIVIALAPLQETMETTVLWLLFAGGVSYTLGVAFFALDRILPQRKYVWMHEIFHLFVLGGSALHTVVMFSLLPSA